MLGGDLKAAVAEMVLSFADDELILAHRNSEWTGHAPILEEDIAFSNIAQDELGHAGLWYDLYRSITGDDPDRMVFFRSSDEYQNAQMVELPIGDWAFTIARQFLFDSYELVNLANLKNSLFKPLADIAAKIRTEELYHYRHTSSWMKRLGLGTVESNRRTQLALEALWPFSGQLFSGSAAGRLLLEADICPGSDKTKGEWEEIVIPFLLDAGFTIPDAGSIAEPRSNHTEHLTELLLEMQETARADPSALW